MFGRSLQKQFQGSILFYVVKEHQDNLSSKAFSSCYLSIKITDASFVSKAYAQKPL